MDWRIARMEARSVRNERGGGLDYGAGGEDEDKRVYFEIYFEDVTNNSC